MVVQFVIPVLVRLSQRGGEFELSLNYFLKYSLWQKNLHTHIHTTPREELYVFSLAYLNCQCHYSSVLEPFLSKVSVTLEPRHCDTMTDDTETATWGAYTLYIRCTRRCITFQAGLHESLLFYMEQRTIKICDFYLWKFPIIFLDHNWHQVNEIVDCKVGDKVVMDFTVHALMSPMMFVLLTIMFRPYSLLF